MRHIPEEELHAYLDQALSRSQCVEIESHLAACPSCSATRDGIAALRDRTTALLARLAPPRRVPPGFPSIAERAEIILDRRRDRIRAAAWAASVAAALAVGFSASSMLDRTGRRSVAAAPANRAQVAAAPARPTPRTTDPIAPPPAESAASGPAAQLAIRTPGAGRTPERAASTNAGRESERTAHAESAPESGPRIPPGPQVRDAEVSTATLGQAGRTPELAGVWRTLSWDRARSESGEEPARIDGLPVMQVQVQQGRASSKPIMVVAQQLKSGDVIRTIEGPVADVSELLAHRGPPAPAPASQTPSGDSNSADGMMAMQRGDRMLAVTGPLPNDSLRAMIRRLNAELRTGR
jgi:hypothetical protein